MLLGIDRDVSSTILLRILGAMSGFGTVVLIPIFMSSEDQGLYYTVASLLAAQVFFELGFNQVLIQMAAHSDSNRRKDQRSGVTALLCTNGDMVQLNRFASKWYLGISIAFLGIATSLGLLYFHQFGGTNKSEINWIWISVASLTAGNLYLSSKLALLEGFGRVSEVSNMRSVANLVGTMALWLTTWTSGSVWAVVCIPAANFASSLIWLARTRNLLLVGKAEARVEETKRLSYKDHVLPLQWRIAVSWVFGYFVMNAITPIVFAIKGPVEAGQIGLAIAVFRGITNIGQSWVSAKLPSMSKLISIRDFPALNSLFLGALIASSVGACLAVVVIFVAQASLDDFAHRLPPFVACLCLAGLSVCNVVTFAFAMYMRAHKREPLVVVSVVNGLLLGVATLFSAKVGLVAITITQISIQVVVVLPWIALIFGNFWRANRELESEFHLEKLKTEQ
jgi:hypothetical protein